MVVLDPQHESVFSGSSNITLSTSILEKTGENFGKYMCSVDNTGTFLAYGVSENGSVWNTIHFKNITSGLHFSEKLGKL